MKKQISVIIPTYNRSQYIAECLESVLANIDGLDAEVLVIDDGSTDDTGEIVRSLEKKYKDLKYVKIPHTGRPGAVRNAGLSKAEGKFIAFQDSDDIWVKGKIDKQMSAFDNETILVYGNISYIDKGGNPTSKPILPSGKERSGYLFPNLINIHRQPVPMPTVVVRRSAIEKVGKFNDSLPLATDTEYWIRLSALGNFKFIDDVLTYVRRHDSNVSTISEDLEGTFMDRLSQVPIYRSVLKSGILNDEQTAQLKWAEIEVIDQLKKLSGRYSHSLVKNYGSPTKNKLVFKRWFRLIKDGVSNLAYYLRNL